MGNRYEPRAQVRLPITVSGTDADGNFFKQTAYACDVSRRGARVDGIGCLRGPGETIEIEHSCKKARFFVIWVGRPGTVEGGHIGIRLLERNKSIWKLDLPRPNTDDFVQAKAAMSKEPQPIWVRKPRHCWILSQSRTTSHNQLRSLSFDSRKNCKNLR